MCGGETDRALKRKLPTRLPCFSKMDKAGRRSCPALRFSAAGHWSLDYVAPGRLELKKTLNNPT